MDKKEIKFEFERAMKNTYGFQEKSSCYPVTGTLYVQKSMFGSKEPKKAKATVEWERGETKRDYWIITDR